MSCVESAFQRFPASNIGIVVEAVNQLLVEACSVSWKCKTGEVMVKWLAGK
jgi:hypothetical protein